MSRLPAGPVLVTGATGFVGGAVVRHLLARGAAVRCLVRDRARAASLDMLGTPVEIHVGDITEPGPHMSEYARSKHEGDEAALRAAREGGLPLDLARTQFRGSLLFDGDSAAAALGISYTPIRRALADAVAEAVAEARGS